MDPLRERTRAFLLVNWSSMAYHGLPWFYHGRRRSVFRSALCCSVFRFTSDRPKLRNAALVLGPGQRGPPTLFRERSVLRAAKRNFVPSRGNFHRSERATLSTRERKRKRKRERKRERERASLITPLVHKSLPLLASFLLVTPFLEPFSTRNRWYFRASVQSRSVVRVT